MAQSISRRHRRLLTHASARDVWKILRSERFTGAEHVELLVNRLDELADTDPLESYELGAGCLPRIFERVGADFSRDLIALGYAALGKASRRLGRLRRAREFYDRACELPGLRDSTWTILYRRRAVLELAHDRYAQAMDFVGRSFVFAHSPDEKSHALIIRGMVEMRRRKFAEAGRAFRTAVKTCPPDSDLQLITLANLAELSVRSGDHEEMASTGALLADLRKRLRGRRSRRARRLNAHVNWTEAKVLIRMGVSGAIVVRRLRRAALGLVRVKFLGDALLCTVELLEYAQDFAETRAVLDICREVLNLANEIGMETHFEAREVLQRIVDARHLEEKELAAFESLVAI